MVVHAFAVEDSNSILRDANNPSENEMISHLKEGEWFSLMEKRQAEKLLAGKKVGTYFFRLDPNGEVILSGINRDGIFEHSKIKKNDAVWLGIQGSLNIAKEVHILIPFCLHLKADECHCLV